MEVSEHSKNNHVTKVWFDDGNLIIEAESSQFRIFKGILAGKSSVFNAMISLPQPAGDESIQGCPLVRLPDSALDVGYFLKAIYDSSFFEPPPTRTHMNIIASVLRLSTKYEVPYLRHRAIRHLDAQYPLTLPLFDDRELSCTTPWTDNTAFFVSTLARELNLLWILPSVLYCICDSSLHSIASGFKWNSTISDDEDPEFDCVDSESESESGGVVMYMHPIDREACLNAILFLTQAEQRDIMGFLTRTDVAGCKTRARCIEGRMMALRELVKVKGESLNPLDVYYDRWGKYSKWVCAVCLDESKCMYEAARKKLWEGLPELFGLPRWEKLEEMQRKALAS